MIALVHYHLEPGGVTSVILATSRLLGSRRIPHLVLTGREPSRPLPGVPFQVIPGLDYSSEIRSLDIPDFHPDLWHFHNPTLGKNRGLPDFVNRLANRGEKILFHLHDLAEDGRPANFANIPDPEELYPLTPRVHYAFLNSRDQSIFQSAGLPASNSHLLFNPVSPETFPPSPSEAPFLLAPIRPIPRKNLPELLLVAALLKTVSPLARIAISLAPTNPEHLPAYQSWKTLAENLRLPLHFEAATPVPFPELQRQATHYISTATNEGFGLTFLDSAAHGKQLIARDIPHVTRDHPAPIGHLYRKIFAAPHGRDFPELDPQHQAALIKNPEDLLIEDRQGKYHPAADWLAQALATPAPSLTESRLAPYSAEAYLEKLLAIYHRVQTSPAGPVSHLSPSSVASRFLRDSVAKAARQTPTARP